MYSYLLNVGELVREGGDSLLLESALSRIDAVRRRKAEQARTPGGKAAALGAGLLLQKAVRDWHGSAAAGGLTAGNVAAGKAERSATACSVAAGKAERSATACSVAAGKAERSATVCGLAAGKAERSATACGVTAGNAEGSAGEGREFCVQCTLSGLLAELADPLPLSYRYGEAGKPYFENLPLYFNISHSGEYVLCAVSGQEVGADIQKFRPVNTEKLAGRFFAESEYRALTDCADDGERQRLFFALWTRKEAYGKLSGKGLVSCVDLPVCDIPGLLWSNLPQPEGYAAAVCRRLHS